MKKIILIMVICLVSFSSINAYSLQYVNNYLGSITYTSPPINAGLFSVGDSFIAQLIYNDDINIPTLFLFDFGHEKLTDRIANYVNYSVHEINFYGTEVYSLNSYSYEPVFFSFVNNTQTSHFDTQLTPDDLVCGHFTTDFITPGGHFGIGADLKLNSTPVPEPATFIMVFLGGAFFLFFKQLKLDFRR